MTGLLKDYNYYLRMERAMSQNTVASYCSDVEQFLAFCNNDVQSFSPSVIEEFLDSRGSLSKRSQARMLSAIRSFCKWLVLEGMMKDNPCDKVDGPKLGRYLPDALSVEEVSSIIDAVDTSSWMGLRDKALLEVLYGCGLRVSEAVGLKVSSIYFKDELIRVIGKGNKERTIYLNNACLEAFAQYMAVRPVDGIPTNDRNALFLSSRNKRISPKTVQHIVYNALEKCGLEGYSVHKLRHTAATLMYQHGGVDPLQLKEILGHENLSTTEIYTHIHDEQLKEAIDSNPLNNLSKLKKS